MEPGFIILLALVVPFMILWPALIWAGAIKSLCSLIRDRISQKARAQNNQAINAT